MPDKPIFDTDEFKTASDSEMALARKHGERFLFEHEGVKVTCYRYAGRIYADDIVITEGLSK